MPLLTGAPTPKTEFPGAPPYLGRQNHDHWTYSVICSSTHVGVEEMIKGTALVWHLLGSACVLSCFSCVQLFTTPWTAARQVPLSMGFSKQEYWSGLPCPSPGIFLTQESSPQLICLLHWQAGSLPLAPSGKCLILFVDSFLQHVNTSFFSTLKLIH